MKYASLILALPLLALTACGAGGGADKIQPPIITNINSLVVQKTIATTPSNPGTEIHGKGINDVDRPDSICGGLLRFNAYRDATHLYLRIEEEFGFCWATDLYEIWIEGIRWRGIPGSVIFTNIGDPANGGNGQGLFRNQSGTRITADDALTPVQFKDNPTDSWFWLKIPLSTFNFIGDNSDFNSTFPIRVLIERIEPGKPARALDWTAVVQVDLVNPPQ